VRAVMRSFGVLLATFIAVAMGPGSVASAATSAAGARTAFSVVRTTASTKIADVHRGFAVARHGSARGLPVFDLGGYRGRRPRTIGFSGDGGNIVGGLRWSSWTQSHAVAGGWSDIQGCVPDCATGAEILVPTVITLGDPVHGYFTRIVERRDGQTVTFLYSRHHAAGSWPDVRFTPSPAGPAASLESYWGDIDTGAYADAWTHLAPSIETQAAFVLSEKAARPTNIELLGTLTGISGNHARVDIHRLLTHDQQYGCRSWSGHYEMVKTGGKWLIDNATITPKAC
jgi:hypothetical protein